jgi:hypothetical protein
LAGNGYPPILDPDQAALDPTASYIPKPMAPPAMPAGTSAPPMADAGAPPAPDSAPLPPSSGAAPHMPDQQQSHWNMHPVSDIQDHHAQMQEGRARRAAKMRDFGDAENEVTAGMLRSPDEFANPLDYSRYIENLHKQKGSIREAKAAYELSHPWGSMESSHPGMWGKVGHAFGQIGNALGEAYAPGLTEAIPGSREHLLAQEAKGQAEAGGAIKEESESAAAGLKGQQAITEATKPALNEAKTDLAGAQEGLANKRADVLSAKPEVEAIHDLMTGENGKPRVNPTTNKPYTYAEAYGHAQLLGKQEKTKTPEQQFIDDYKTTHPNAPMDEVIRAYTQATNRPEKPGAANSRSDRSYQFQVGRLDKIRKPVDEASTRFSKLQDTLNQHSPQADALVAPELLSVMAGGVGSGVRMNEAEISRIVGGRSAWESLKAKIQHWSTNPDDARSITPDQDRQIRALMGTVHDKLTAKQKIIDEANDRLIGSDDEKEHRQIVAETQHRLDQIDSGGVTGGTNEPGATPTAPTAGGGFAAWKKNATRPQ